MGIGTEEEFYFARSSMPSRRADSYVQRTEARQADSHAPSQADIEAAKYLRLQPVGAMVFVEHLTYLWQERSNSDGLTPEIRARVLNHKPYYEKRGVTFTDLR
jgi:hypothetical protein